MTIIPYKANHYPSLVKILKSQEVTYTVSPDSIPRIGFTAIKRRKVVAMGFLRQVEGGYAQIDGICSLASEPSDVRHEAISQIVTEIINKAKEMHIKGLICYSVDKSILMRAKALGFNTLEQHTVISLPLS